jgi:hypothetical protein
MQNQLHNRSLLTNRSQIQPILNQAQQRKNERRKRRVVPLLVLVHQTTILFNTSDYSEIGRNPNSL